MGWWYTSDLGGPVPCEPAGVLVSCSIDRRREHLDISGPVTDCPAPTPGCDPATFLARPTVANATVPRTPSQAPRPSRPLLRSPSRPCLQAAAARIRAPFSCRFTPTTTTPTCRSFRPPPTLFLFGPRPRSRTPMVRGRGRGPNRPPNSVNIGHPQPRPRIRDPGSSPGVNPHPNPPTVRCRSSSNPALRVMPTTLLVLPASGSVTRSARAAGRCWAWSPGAAATRRRSA